MRFRNTAVSFDHVFDARLPFEDEEVAMLAMDLVSTTEHVLDSSPHARLLSAQEGLSEAGIQERGAIQTQIIEEVFSGYGPYLDTLQSTLVAAGQEQVGGVVQSAAKAFIGEALDLCARRDGLGVWNIAMALKYSLKRFHRSRVLRLGREQALDSELGELREKIAEESRIRDHLNEANLGERKRERVNHWNGRLAWKEERSARTRLQIERERGQRDQRETMDDQSDV